jgi:hypothetical protein
VTPEGVLADLLTSPLALCQHAATNPTLRCRESVRVLAYLTKHLRFDGYDPVTQFRVSHILKVKQRTVRRSLDELELAGYIIPGPRLYRDARRTFRLSHPDTPNL